MESAMLTTPISDKLGPNSLTWKYLGDSRNLLVTLRTGLLQAMHPAINAGLIDHSDFFDDPFGRLARSAPPILGVIYDRDPEATGVWVRDQHPPIRGTDRQGRNYNALDPDVYYWAHATFFEAQITAQDLFGKPLTTYERERLYDESISWYARYAVTMRPVPENYAAFVDYWNYMIDEVLESTKLAQLSVRRSGKIPPPDIRGVGPKVWSLVEPAASRIGPWTIRCALPENARDKLGLEVSQPEQVAFDVLCRTVRMAWPLMPADKKRLPKAYIADRRVIAGCSSRRTKREVPPLNRSQHALRLLRSVSSRLVSRRRT